VLHDEIDRLDECEKYLLKKEKKKEQKHKRQFHRKRQQKN